VPTSYRVGGGEETPEAPLGTVAAGSNNWAVSAALSASGRPVVANDPHVPFLPLPTFWHHLHLHGPDYRVQGGMFPGFPAFGFGHNGALAWGCTTVCRDGYDLYRIHRLPEDAARYRTARGSGAITRFREELPGRLGRRVTIEWESCEHGILYPGWRHHDGVVSPASHYGVQVPRCHKIGPVPADLHELHGVGVDAGAEDDGTDAGRCSCHDHDRSRRFLSGEVSPDRAITI